MRSGLRERVIGWPKKIETGRTTAGRADPFHRMNAAPTTEVALLSTPFLRKIHEPFTAHPSWNLWIRWIEYGLNASRIFVRITQGDTTFVCAVGDPAESDEEDDALFLPLWMLDTGHFVLSETVREPRNGEDAFTPRSHVPNAQVAVLLATDLPPATRILLRPVESYLSAVDIKNALQPVLTQLGVFQQGIQYEIPLEELGGLRVNFVVEELEPAPVVLLDGEEVAIEFSQAVEEILPPRDIVSVSPPALPRSPPTTPVSMLPSTFLSDWGVTPPTTPPAHRTAAEQAELRARRLAVFRPVTE